MHRVNLKIPTSKTFKCMFLQSILFDTNGCVHTSEIAIGIISLGKRKCCDLHWLPLKRLSIEVHISSGISWWTTRLHYISCRLKSPSRTDLPHSDSMGSRPDLSQSPQGCVRKCKGPQISSAYLGQILKKCLKEKRFSTSF